MWELLHNIVLLFLNLFCGLELQYGELDKLGSEQGILQSPCTCGIEPPGAISHGVSYMVLKEAELKS